MQKAFKNAGKGLFHRQLGVPRGEKIPLTLLQAIVNAPIGTTITNPTKVGSRKIKVTYLIKKRASPLLTADRINKR